MSDEWGRRLGAAVDKLSPGGAGWWHPDTADVISAALEALVGQAMPLDEAADLLGSVIGAISGEYGD